MDGGAWWATVHGVTKSQTRLSDFTFTFHFHALQKETATHSSVLARRIPGTGEPGGLPSMGSHRVRHDWSDLAAVAQHLLAVDIIGLPTQSSLLPAWLKKPQFSSGWPHGQPQAMGLNQRQHRFPFPDSLAARVSMWDSCWQQDLQGSLLRGFWESFWFFDKRKQALPQGSWGQPFPLPPT